MKKIILIILILIIVLAGIAGLYFFTFNYKKQPESVIIFRNYSEKYPESPEELLEENNHLIKLLYSGRISETDLDSALDNQIKLFSEQLLKVNDGYIDYMKQDIVKFKEAKVYLNDIKVNSIIKDKYSDKIYLAEVQQIFDENYVNNVKYYIIEENEKYSILAWEYFGEGYADK